MSKNLSSKKRKQRKMYKRMVMVALCIFVLLIAVILIEDKSKSYITYTPEEMVHDHDGDGVPDH